MYVHARCTLLLKMLNLCKMSTKFGFPSRLLFKRQSRRRNCITSFGLILFTNLKCIGWFGTSLCTSTFLFLSTVSRENLATSEVCGMLLSWKPYFKPKLVCDFLSDFYPILDMNYEEVVSTVWLALFDVPTYCTLILLSCPKQPFSVRSRARGHFFQSTH